MPGRSKKLLKRSMQASTALTAPRSFRACQPLTTNNAQGEYYLTDVLSLMIDDGLKVGVVVCEDSNDVLGINDRVQLAYCEALMRRRKNVELMKAGVTIIAPETVFIDQGVEIGADTIIRPNTIIEGHTVIGEECDIRPLGKNHQHRGWGKR